MADTDPLLGVEGSPGPEDNFLPDVIFFHGKELRSGMGMRQSFIRKPGMEQVLVRIGIGRDGIYKVDGVENKIVEHWQFADLKDWSFSGYSCTIQFRSTKHNYSVRTDDGETICSYIDDFQKHPEKALKRARENPPNSKIPESGVRTLRKKFSGTGPGPAPLASDQVKFYTMNRRTSKKAADPTSKIAHNIEVDSRLRDAYSQKTTNSDAETNLLVPLKSNGERSKVNGIPPTNDDPTVSAAVPSHVPMTTKGESTENQTTHPTTKSSPGTSSPLQPSSPASLRRTAAPLEQQNSEPILQIDESGSTQQSSGTHRGSPGAEDPGNYFVLRQRSMSETTVQRGNARPINLVKTVSMPWGENGGGKPPRKGSLPIVTESGGKQAKQHRPSPVVTRSISPSSGNNSSKGVSPDLDSQSVPTKQPPGRQSSRDGGGNMWYQSPPTPDEDDKPRQASPPYDTLSRSDSGMSSERLEFGAGIRSLKRDETTSSMDEFRFNLSSPPSSPLYDHLPPSQGDEDGGGPSPSPPLPQAKKPPHVASSPVDIPIRRNTSLPAVSGRDEGGRTGGGGLTTRNSTSPIPDSIVEGDEEEDSDNQETAGQTGGVVLRRKPSNHKDSDPFEDLLGTPQAVARLRWSQELNPLYDLIKGMKISESMSSQDKGIKLYSTSAPSDSGSRKKLKKLPSVIFEERETSPKYTGTDAVPAITHSLHEGEEEQRDEAEEEGDRIPMIIPENRALNLPRAPRRQHNYEEVNFAAEPVDVKTTSIAGLIQPPPQVTRKSATLGTTKGVAGGGGGGGKSSLTLANPVVHRLQTLEAPQERSASVSPRLGKRQLQRRSQTVSCVDDTEAITRKQKSLRAADMMKDFSFVMREFRLFYVKMPNGCIHSEVFGINRPVAELRDKLCELLGVGNTDHYVLYVEGACLTSLKEVELGEQGTMQQQGVVRSSSLTHIMDHQWLPDQGSEPVLLKPSLSLHMQGITTSRVLALMCDDVVVEANNTYPQYLPVEDEAEEFHKHWVSIVQGNIPCTQEQAVKLAAVQYQAYFLDRTAVHSVVGFCRPNEFLPTEFSGVRGMEQKMYKEQEKLKGMKKHKAVHHAYVKLMARLPTADTIFFPVREPRKKVLQSTKLKSVILGVGPRGIMRVDPKTKEVLDTWDFQVLRNWAYSRKTFVLAFTDKNYPVESNQAKWISMIVDFFVDSIINTAGSSRL